VRIATPHLRRLLRVAEEAQEEDGGVEFGEVELEHRTFGKTRGTEVDPWVRGIPGPGLELVEASRNGGGAYLPLAGRQKFWGVEDRAGKETEEVQRIGHEPGTVSSGGEGFERKTEQHGASTATGAVVGDRGGTGAATDVFEDGGGAVAFGGEDVREADGVSAAGFGAEAEFG
jgi:hypothetical protein